jgi:hypothetical protein
MDEVTACDGTHILGMHIYWTDNFVRKSAFVGLGHIPKAPDACYLL